MGLILHRCPDDLPARIPDILSRLPCTVVCSGGLENEPNPDFAHRYLVERGMGRILIDACREGSLMTVTITAPSPNPLRSKSSYQLSKEVTAALEAGGMKQLTVEELERLDTELTENKC